MAIVKVIMMQRDEGDSLLRWVSHYANLFGFSNLSIMDNGSRDPYTIDILKWVEHSGSHIYWNLDTRHDFHNKGGHIGNVIRHWDAGPAYDFALPVDCDEILAVFTDKGLTTETSAIHAEFDSLLNIQQALRIDTSMFNVPGRPGWYSPVRHFHKGFLRSNSIDITDSGHHEPKSRLAEGYEVTRFTYLHWHNPDFDAYRAAAKRKLEGIVDTSSVKAMRDYGRNLGAEGAHLIQAILMSKSKYLTQYDKELQLYVGEGSFINFLSLPDKRTHLWNSDAYLTRNPDVLRYSLSPLHHYVRWGFPEGRSLA